jgi:serralysin
MSYGRQDALGHAASNIPFETPAMADILAMGTLYGFRENHASDTTYGFGNNTGQSAFDFSLTDPASFTIYDTSGTDTIDASLYSDDQRISLDGGTWSSIGGLIDNIGIYVTSVIENARGGPGSDVITGNAAANTISGGMGNDTISGGAGNDTLFGDEGSDVFIFGAGFGSDRILDLDADPAGGQDHIDIRSMGIASFSNSVTITDLGSDTLVRIGADSMLLIGVDGVGANRITQDDFLWH